MTKHKQQNTSNFKKTVTILLTLILISGIILFIKIKLTEHIENEMQREVSEVLDTIDVPSEDITDNSLNPTTERMLKLRELQKANTDIVGWLEIAGTNINYPVLQGEDNDYYLKHNYKHEYIFTGSIFLDKDYDFDKPSENLLIYGHRNKVGLMFDELIKYKDKAFYNEHKTIRFTTEKSDDTYEVMSAFYSRVYYTNETNVFRYYNFVNANNELDYAEFVSNAKDVSLYDTGVTATYGEQLMTLSTCDYTQENGRFVVVAKKVY